MLAQLMSLSRQGWSMSRHCCLLVCRGLVATLALSMQLLVLILHCHEKVVKCRDIHATFMFPFFVVSLLQQY